MKEVPFIGHRLRAEVLEAAPAKVEAISKMPTPTDPKSVRQFTGMVNYMAKLIPNLSDILEPLRQLTHK